MALCHHLIAQDNIWMKGLLTKVKVPQEIVWLTQNSHFEHWFVWVITTELMFQNRMKISGINHGMWRFSVGVKTFALFKGLKQFHNCGLPNVVWPKLLLAQLAWSEAMVDGSCRPIFEGPQLPCSCSNYCMEQSFYPSYGSLYITLSVTIVALNKGSRTADSSHEIQTRDLGKAFRCSHDSQVIITIKPHDVYEVARQQVLGKVLFSCFCCVKGYHSFFAM